jgi:hypothetical protein
MEMDFISRERNEVRQTRAIATERFPRDAAAEWDDQFSLKPLTRFAVPHLMMQSERLTLI